MAARNAISERWDMREREVNRLWYPNVENTQRTPRLIPPWKTLIWRRRSHLETLFFNVFMSDNFIYVDDGYSCKV